MRPLCITDLEDGGHDQEIRSFGQFLPQTSSFHLNRRLTPTDFEWKFGNFENPKKLIYGTDMYKWSGIWGSRHGLRF
jgi:hypothetical protein